MPLPKKLQLQVPVNESQQGASVSESQQLQASLNFNNSLRINNQDEITMLTRSYNPYNFTKEGFTSKGANSQHYKISEKDIWIIRRLGSGASSTVFKGFYFKENRFVAVKKINVLDREMRHQMLNDVKALCDARAVPGLIAFAGAYHMPDSGQIAIILEYMDGGSLQDVLARVGTIPEDILSRITAKILVGLTYLHRQKHMVHRDIKPGNILLNSDGDPKITDFGISAFIDSTLAVCNTFLGTVTYMSPERINNEQYSFSADIWSLGLVLIECATGRYPYDASVGPLQLMIQVLNDDIPLPEGPNASPAFRDFLSQCMRKSPYERPSAEQLLQHPFITAHAGGPPGVLRDYMRKVFDPHDKLDEITIIFTWNYYALLSGGPAQLQALAPLYSDASTLMHDGVQCQGRNAIMAQLAAASNANASRRLQKHEVKSVDCQPLGVDGSALVHVQGVQVPDGPSTTDAPLPSFTEAFILCQVQPGEYYVANQVHRTLSSR